MTRPEDAVAAASPEEPTARVPGGTAVRRHRGLLAVAAGAGVLVLLYLAYFLQAGSYGSDADGASNVLQAWDMLHGNLLLSGWWLSDVAFYTTELPEYMIVELIHGMNGTTETLAAAATYTLMVLLAAVVAKGQATGAQGLTRALIAGGIMLAPWGQYGGGQLLSVPNHAGTVVPLLVIWLLIDRLGDRWYLPWLVGVLLTWVEIADQIAVYIGAVPIVVVAIIRLIQRRESWRLDAGLLVAGAASVVAADAITAGIRRAGGYVVQPVHPVIAAASAVPAHLAWTAESALALFGASFPGVPPGPSLAVSVLHLVGVLLALWAFGIGAWQLLRARDRLVPMLVVDIVVLVAAFVFTNEAIGLGSSHEIAPVVAFGAVLAGRLLPGRRVITTLRPVLLAALVAYAAVLGYSTTRPAPQSQLAAVQSWLTARHQTAGLGGYWAANIMTVNTSGRIAVRGVTTSCGRFAPYAWETKKQWYEPPNTANFLIIPLPSGRMNGTPGEARAQFGAPRMTARIGPYEVLVWNRNLLPAVTTGFRPRCGQSWKR